MRKYHIALIATLLASLQSAQVQGFELTGDATLGSDSNPYKLQDGLDKSSGAYVAVGLAATDQLSDHLTVQVGLKNRTYENNFDDADETRAKAELAYAEKFKLFGKRSRYRLKAEYSYKNDSFVSRATGRIATAAGSESLADRFDSDKWTIAGKVSTRLTRRVTTGVELKYQVKDYQDFNIAGLTDLDYEEFSLLNDWAYRWSRKNKSFVDIGVGQRHYDNREERDSAGVTVAGTDLEYDYFAVAIGHKVKLKRHTKLGFKISYDRRDDSGSGFYDKDAIKFDVKLDHRLRNGVRLDFEVSYLEREYSATIDPVLSESEEEGEPLNDKHGYTVEMGVERDLTITAGVKSILFARATYADISSDSPIFTYDRAQVEIGIKASW